MTTRKKHEPWNRLLWGVEFTSPRSPPELIGELWAVYPIVSRYPGEPTRALLFTTRKAARDWCRNKNAQWKSRKDFVRFWHVRPVRVRERVSVVK